MQAEKTGASFDPIVFWVSASITIAFVIGSILFPESMNTVINAVFAWTTVSRIHSVNILFSHRSHPRTVIILPDHQSRPHCP